MASVRFCPFCREAFEAEQACPEHGLQLMEFRDLPSTDMSVPDAHARLAPWDLRFGRLWLLLSGVLVLLSFALPLASMHGAVEAGGQLFRLAMGRAKTLWLVPAAGCGLLAICARGRTLARLRTVRVAVGCLALTPLAVAGIRLRGAFRAADLMAAQAGKAVHVSVGWGFYLLCLGAALGVLASATLGLVRRTATPVQEVD